MSETLAVVPDLAREPGSLPAGELLAEGAAAGTPVAGASAPGVSAAGPAEVTGYVEAAAGEALLGWAWSPRDPAVRVVVELRLGAEVLGTAVADQAREDLARNGIGDGRHAFRLAVPESVRARVGELHVAGRAGDGEAVALGRPPMAEDVATRLDRLQRGLDMVVASQRVLHRNLQAALLQAAGGAGGGGGDGAPDRAVFAEQLRTLEIFVLRLDERLAALAEPAVVLRPSLIGGRVAAAVGLVAVLLLGVAGLVRSLAG